MSKQYLLWSTSKKFLWKKNTFIKLGYMHTLFLNWRISVHEMFLEVCAVDSRRLWRGFLAKFSYRRQMINVKTLLEIFEYFEENYLF